MEFVLRLNYLIQKKSYYHFLPMESKFNEIGKIEILGEPKETARGSFLSRNILD